MKTITSLILVLLSLSLTNPLHADLLGSISDLNDIVEVVSHDRYSNTRKVDRTIRVLERRQKRIEREERARQREIEREERRRARELERARVKQARAEAEASKAESVKAKDVVKSTSK